MFADLNLGDITPFFAAFIAASLIGLAFGWSAQRSRFCLRQAIVGENKLSAGAVWAMAALVALLGTSWVKSQDVVAFEDHLLFANNLPIVAILLGGALFGYGMVLTRGCASRLTVLAAGGNLRAVYVVVLFAIIAHAALKGVLSPLRQAVNAYTLDIGGAVPQITAYGIAAIALVIIIQAVRTGAVRLSHLGYAAVIGLLVPASWYITGWVLYDDFDVIPLQQLSMTLPATDTLFYLIASSSVQLGFSVGFIGGLILGAGLASFAYGETRFQSFESAAQWRSYTVGAAFMGFGAVIAGGCTLGAALSGISSLSVAGILAFLAIIGGAKLAQIISGISLGSARQATTLAQQPAE